MTIWGRPRRGRTLYINLPVRDLRRSMRFFARLGFGFDARFTDDEAACLIVSEAAFVMLLSERFFQTFNPKSACDTRVRVEGLFVLSCPSRSEVSALFGEAIAAGAMPAGDAIDHGFAYAASFHDLDGHQWWVRWADPDPVLA